MLVDKVLAYVLLSYEQHLNTQLIYHIILFISLFLLNTANYLFVIYNLLYIYRYYFTFTPKPKIIHFMHYHCVEINICVIYI